MCPWDWTISVYKRDTVIAALSSSDNFLLGKNGLYQVKVVVLNLLVVLFSALDMPVIIYRTLDNIIWEITHLFSWILLLLLLKSELCSMTSFLSNYNLEGNRAVSCWVINFKGQTSTNLSKSSATYCHIYLMLVVWLTWAIFCLWSLFEWLLKSFTYPLTYIKCIWNFYSPIQPLNILRYADTLMKHALYPVVVVGIRLPMKGK